MDDRKKIKNILQKALPRVRDHLDITESFLIELVAEEVITHADSQKLTAINVSNVQVDRLFDIIKRKPKKNYLSFMELLKNHDSDIYQTIMKIQQEMKLGHGGTHHTPAQSQQQIASRAQSHSDGMEKVTDDDIDDVAGGAGLKLEQLKHLYVKLGLAANEIQKEEIGVGLPDFTLQAAAVLKHWRQINGKAATRRKIIDALDKCGLNEAKGILEEKWGIETLSELPSPEPGVRPRNLIQMPRQISPPKQDKRSKTVSLTQDKRSETVSLTQGSLKTPLVAGGVAIVFIAVMITWYLTDKSSETPNKIPSPKSESLSTTQTANSGETLISNNDIRTIARDLGLTHDQLNRVYNELGLSSANVENAEGSKGAKDITLKTISVLEYWRQDKGDLATREAILDALKKSRLNYAVNELKKKWQI